MLILHSMDLCFHENLINFFVKKGFQPVAILRLLLEPPSFSDILGRVCTMSVTFWLTKSRPLRKKCFDSISAIENWFKSKPGSKPLNTFVIFKVTQ